MALLSSPLLDSIEVQLVEARQQLRARKIEEAGLMQQLIHLLLPASINPSEAIQVREGALLHNGQDNVEAFAAPIIIDNNGVVNDKEAIQSEAIKDNSAITEVGAAIQAVAMDVDQPCAPLLEADKPLEDYPFIVTLNDGRIVQLCCPECKGNSTEVLHAGGASRSRFLPFKGTKGLLVHIMQVHKVKLTREEILLHCWEIEYSGDEIEKIRKGELDVETVVGRVHDRGSGKTKKKKAGRSDKDQTSL